MNKGPELLNVELRGLFLYVARDSVKRLRSRAHRGSSGAHARWQTVEAGPRELDLAPPHI